MIYCYMLLYTRHISYHQPPRAVHTRLPRVMQGMVLDANPHLKELDRYGCGGLKLQGSGFEGIIGLRVSGYICFGA